MHMPDFQQVLNLESSNKQAMSEIKRINRLQKEEEEKLKKSQEPSNIVHAIEKPFHLRSTVSTVMCNHNIIILQANPIRRLIVKPVITGVDLNQACILRNTRYIDIIRVLDCIALLSELILNGLPNAVSNYCQAYITFCDCK